MHLRRRYGDGCGIAQALDVVGERWALLIVRDLVLGPKRFTDLKAGLPGAGPNILTSRLRDLEAAGVVRRRTLPPPAGSKVYELTEWGAQLDPILSRLGAWGIRSPVVAPDGDLGADSVMLALRNAFVPGGPSWTARFEFRLGPDRFTVRVADGRLAEVSRGLPREPPAATVETDPKTLVALLGRRQTVPAAMTAGVLAITGDPRAVQRLFDAART
ncbi:winged helix-turn-helix transcriptional regulator [Actinosynnema sp. CS-041913]|uniref:winged helix-turn-helix transcriptional regulator n=1 Tax=Actinosynnema sp. CS-041913 TaxID=3239917 RepID=UPI003D8BECE8